MRIRDLKEDKFVVGMRVKSFSKSKYGIVIRIG
jgi:hypothetical protein